MFVIVDLQEATACTIGKISPILLAAAESVTPMGGGKLVSRIRGVRGKGGKIRKQLEFAHKNNV